MEKNNFRFSFMQQYKDNSSFWVFRKGKILPVATVEITPCKARVNMLSNKEKRNDIEDEFERFSGCSF